ncbi:hypothetical protein Tco_0619907 [Tanacetum coccineum]
MSNHEQPTPSHPRSDVRNTIGKDKQTPPGSARTTSDVDLEEFCEKHYEKTIPNPRRNKRERSRSPRHEYKSKERRESTVFKRLGGRGRITSAHSDSRQESSRYTKNYSESEDSEGGHWKSKYEGKSFSVEDDDLSHPWYRAETDPFTSQIRHFDFPKTRMPSHVKTYNGSEDPEDHLKIFQAAAKTERWVTGHPWCHRFNFHASTSGNARKKCNQRSHRCFHNINAKRRIVPQKTATKRKKNTKIRKVRPPGKEKPQANLNDPVTANCNKTEDNSKFPTRPRDIIPTPGEHEGAEGPLI